jgi:hypothetical protein
VELQLSSFEEVERWVLGFSGHAWAVFPPAFVERLRKTTAGMVARHSLGSES